MNTFARRNLNACPLFLFLTQYLVTRVYSLRKDQLPSYITTNIGGIEGDWLPENLCSENKFVNGYQLIFEELWILGLVPRVDFSGLNGIRIFCNDINFSGKEELKPGDGPFPNYIQDSIICGFEGKNSFLIGYELYLGNEYQGVLGIKGICLNFYGEHMTFVDKGEFDTNVQKESVICPPGTIICGMQLRIESEQGGFSAGFV